MRVEFKESFLKDLRSIKDKSLKARVKDAIENVENAKRLDEINHFKKLKLGRNYYRIRISDYRIGLKVENEIVTFIRILNRKDIYRYFP